MQDGKEGNTRIYSRRRERGRLKKRKERRVRCDGLLGAWESESFGNTEPSLCYFFFFFLVFSGFLSFY